MRRQSQEEVAAAARRRLELLGRELEQSGLPRLDEPSEIDPDPWLPPEQPATGRHVRSEPGMAARARSWVADQVPETLRGQVGLGRGPALLVVVLVGLAVLGTAVVVLRMSGGSQPVAKPASGKPLATLASPSPSSSPSASASGSVTVDVAGKVRRPGVAVLPTGSRVVDALRRAGGARGGVDLTGLNLARVLVDGEQILVGARAPSAPVAASATPSGSSDGPLVNLNTATAEQLDTLPGVGPVTAQKILDWRTAHGSFSSIDELLEVDGIGEKTLADIAPKATL